MCNFTALKKTYIQLCAKTIYYQAVKMFFRLLNIFSKAVEEGTVVMLYHHLFVQSVHTAETAVCGDVDMFTSVVGKITVNPTARTLEIQAAKLRNTPV